MEDSGILGNINQLADEEHALSEKESKGEATEEDRQRLKRIQVTLDQCWDYLNQRRDHGRALHAITSARSLRHIGGNNPGPATLLRP